ncbi:MAG: hypothetical protein JRM89_02295 [Nitrososphaerota archaeon]|nr:hypothetical protein [Nitrososphaerota archaeon]MDG6938219.1 hypothetical protein [Nitrososphaerota archaeon]MDG6959412.1 hypothetical protein [Nitrososphaerota archaeon]MDG7014799.1 hypothetical protein [Nitrososphaerota archaeon]WGO50764.1 MAG: hypothetical protein JRM93_01760 [Nitrososphaerota archaeon]
MAAAAESVSRSDGFRSSALKRPLSLYSGGCRLQVDPDGAVRSLESQREKRALFGLEQVWFYKVQAGIVVPGQRPDWLVKLAPEEARLLGRVFDVEVAQSIEFFPGASPGFVRRIALRNAGRSQLRLRVLEVTDVAGAHFETHARWGSLGVNAFNRESHVAMDEVSDPPASRVVGASPPPSRYHLTTSKPRALEAVATGEVPEGTAGMSGQVLTISAHELDLPPGESRDIAFASIYTPGKLEEALAEFGRLRTAGGRPPPPSPELACSDPSVAEAAAWALEAVRSAPYADDLLDRLESLKALIYFEPKLASAVQSEARTLARRDGALPHSLDRSRPGILETAVLLQAASSALLLGQDKKASRASYPFVKKLGAFLMASSKDATVATDPALPQGWRRRLGRGYPTHEIPEVSLAVAGGLEGASLVARAMSRHDDAGRFLERSKLISERVRKKLLDERGFLSLCRDSAGRLRTDETADMAVAAFRHPFMASAEQAAAHRLLERDFDTPYGPRSVPTSNLMYFNGSYGDGQLGGVWTRAALAYALLCYRTGLAGVGGLALAKAARVVADDSLRLGAPPGFFPSWVDVEAREAHGDGPDPVAAARFLQCLLEGELGLPQGAERGSIAPAASSNFEWVLAAGFWAGGDSAAFVGRGGGRARLFYSGTKLESRGSARFAGWERVDTGVRSVRGISFHTPGQVVCLGNSSPGPVRLNVAFPPRAAELARRLSTNLEEFDPAAGSWTKLGTVRVSTSMGFEAAVGPAGWKAYRVSTP